MNNQLKEPQAPDFATWKSVKIDSVFYHKENPIPVSRLCKEHDENISNWLGYHFHYITGDGLACGRAFNVFSKGVFLKRWKLLGDPEDIYWFSVPTNGVWQVYSGKYCTVRLVSALSKTVFPIITELELIVETRDGRRRFATLKIQRD